MATEEERGCVTKGGPIEAGRGWPGEAAAGSKNVTGWVGREGISVVSEDFSLPTHFKDEETEAQEGHMDHLGSTG